MGQITRRDALHLGAGLAAATALGTGSVWAEIPVKDVAPPKFEIESGASLRVLRPAKFVSADETIFNENSKKFTDATGVPVKVEYESWEDLRPKTAVAASVGTGPDIVCAWSDDPQQYADKVVDLTDLATYLGDKYGGWWPTAQKYGQTPDGSKWVGCPLGASGGRVVYRKSWVNEAGYEEIPTDLDGFLALCRKLKETGHPAGFALGNAVGDGNAWVHWVVWAHGGSMVDEEDQVTINSPETIEALKYAKALYETFIPGTESWLDPSNNKAFLAGQIGLTNNGISVFFSARNSDDPNMKAMAEDIYHAKMPIGPVGKPTERPLVVNPMVFQYTQYPNASKEYIRFMLEREQYEPFLNGCLGYWGHPLQAYEQAAIWTEEPKALAYRDVLKDGIWDGYKGTLNAASQAVLADYVMLQMVASVCTGQSTPEDAAAEAERRAKRYYRS
ncbi:MAG: extracellular solute-binding protein [Geminicoccaceae bacterium]